MAVKDLTGDESKEEVVQLMTKALIIMIDDGVSEKQACEIMLGALRLRKHPEAFAQHFVRLRGALREHNAKKGGTEG